MQEQQELIASIREGMQVEDADGDAVGTVQEACLPAGAGPNPGAVAKQAYIKVSVGIMGIGGHWYVPLGAVRTVVDDRVILNVDQTGLDKLGWDKPPEHQATEDLASRAPASGPSQERGKG